MITNPPKTVSISGTVNVEYATAWNKALFTNQTAVTGQVIASGGMLGGWHVYNPNTDVTYIQIFGTAATITVGTTSPSMSVGIPGGAAANVEFARGVSMVSAIKIAATASPSGTTSPTQAIVANILYR